MASFICSSKFLLLLLFTSAIPIAFIVSLERSKPTTHVFDYVSTGWLRESAKWDDTNRRFIVSFMEGGLGQVSVPEDHSSGSVLEEVVVVKEADLLGNASLGLVIDRPRNRVVVAVADLLGNRYGGLVAYDLTSWNRLFLTHLSGPDEKTFADDVAIDAEGNAYVTDAKGNKIWKVGVDGSFISIIKSPLFSAKEWYNNLVGLNGIIYHPNGYLLVVHTFSGNLYKIDVVKEEVKLVKLVGSLKFGDGMELFSPTKLVVIGNPSTKLVESSDDWETAEVVGKFGAGLTHRIATAATVKDGKVYLSHLFGLGFPRKTHKLVEAVFSS